MEIELTNLPENSRLLCVECGARWRLHGTMKAGFFSLVYGDVCEPCCDNSPDFLNKLIPMNEESIRKHMIAGWVKNGASPEEAERKLNYRVKCLNTLSYSLHAFHSEAKTLTDYAPEIDV